MDAHEALNLIALLEQEYVEAGTDSATIESAAFAFIRQVRATLKDVMQDAAHA